MNMLPDEFVKKSTNLLLAQKARVTKLSKCSPNGRLFALGSFSIIKKSIPYFCETFFKTIECVLISTKIVLGYTLGDFLISSSGHPAKAPQSVSYSCHS
jgi:hypothetical protein